MTTPRPMTAWTDADWARWAGIRTDVVTRSRPAAREARLAAFVIGFGVVAALLSILPVRLPGEVRESELQPIDVPLCSGCPPAQQILAAGVSTYDRRTWLTARFAASPAGNGFNLLTGDHTSPLRFEQHADGNWFISAPAGTALPLSSFTVGTRGRVVVLELPLDGAAGAVIRSDDGVRFPETGLLPVRTPSARGVNAIDLAVAVVLLAGAWSGYRRGARAMGIQLGAIAIVLLLLRGLSVLVTGVSAGVPLVAAAFACGAGIALVSVTGHFALLRAFRTGRATHGEAPRERGLGALLGIVQAGMIAAMLLSLMADQAMLDGLSAIAESSRAGAPLVQAWRGFILWT